TKKEKKHASQVTCKHSKVGTSATQDNFKSLLSLDEGKSNLFGLLGNGCRLQGIQRMKYKLRHHQPIVIQEAPKLLSVFLTPTHVVTTGTACFNMDIHIGSKLF
ncbi:hypothetical protein C5167_039643, partial [Papaver somniferum]